MSIFDTLDRYPCPLLHFQASPICLIVQAQPHLANATRLLSNKADDADIQITTLLKLYRRQQGGMGEMPIPVPTSYVGIARMMGQPNTQAHAYWQQFQARPHPRIPLPQLL